MRRVIYEDRDCYGRTPLCIAAEKGRLTIAKLLLASGASVDGLHRIRAARPLHNAIESNHYEIAELLLKYRASVDKDDGFQENSLHHACKQGNPEFVKLLLKYGFEETHVLNQSNFHRCTPLQHKCFTFGSASPASSPYLVASIKWWISSKGGERDSSRYSRPETKDGGGIYYTQASTKPPSSD